MVKYTFRIELNNAMMIFRNKYGLGYGLATLLNLSIAIFTASFIVFVVRQSLLTFVIGFFCFFDEEMMIARRDLSEVQKTLEGHNRIFCYDIQFILFSPIAGFIAVINLTQQMPKILLYFAIFYLVFFLIYTTYRWYCICTLSEARSAFTRRSLPVGATPGRRYVSQYIAAGIKILPETGRVIGLAGNLASLAAGHCAVHKITYGLQSRPAIFNIISYCRLGLTCSSDIGYGLGVGLVSTVEPYDPELRAKITEPGTYGKLNSKKVIDYIVDNASKDTSVGEALRADYELVDAAITAKRHFDEAVKKIK